MPDMNGYSFPIHENTMKRITKSRRPAPLPVPLNETIVGTRRERYREPIKQAAHDDHAAARDA